MSRSHDLHMPTGGRISVETEPLRILVDFGNGLEVHTVVGTAYPAAPLARRHGHEWSMPTGTPRISAGRDYVGLEWPDGNTLRLAAPADGTVELVYAAPGALATAFAITSAGNEHYYGLGERFDSLDQRGQLIDLWVTNGASGTRTYKPVPFVLSSRGFGLALETSRRVFCQLAHPTLPASATFTVDGPELAATLLSGPSPAAVLGRYTQHVGRPPVPPEWVFLPWKSRDWRTEDQRTAIEDIDRQRELELACGVKLIDATWEPDSHTLTFDPAKYPDPEALIDHARASGVEVVLWISPSMTAGGDAYREAADRGLLILGADGRPYLHQLGNEPSWQGSAIDFTQPAAIAWWQERLRRLLDMGVRGFKTDFGEQVPVDAVFSDGRTGDELHNLYPVLYNRATWEVVREYDGILLARSAWAGSQAIPAIWAGDQSSDFSPWAGLRTAIMAGQSAGLSGFPYWGSDIGGYFGTPTDEALIRWTQFAAFTPIMELHGLGAREPWLFDAATLAIYRRFANLHACLAPYTRAAAVQAETTGLPVMRAMPLAFPNDPRSHDEQLHTQYLYGPDLLVAPMYWWGTSRLVYFPEGLWIDYFSGEQMRGPTHRRVPAPLDTVPVYARAGAVLPLRVDPWTSSDEALDIHLYPGPSGGAFQLPDGTQVESRAQAADRFEVQVSGPDRDYRLLVPHHALDSIQARDGQVRMVDGTAVWRGSARFSIGLEY